MLMVTRFLATATVALVFLLGACTDQMSQPFAPESADVTTQISPMQTGSGAPAYLIDNVCPNVNPNGTCATTFNGSDLYYVNFPGPNVIALRLFALRGNCAVNEPALDCSTAFNRGQIAVTPNGAQVWVIQNPTGGSGASNNVGFYSFATGTFTSLGTISGIGGQGLVMAGFSPNSSLPFGTLAGLFVGNQSTNRIYRLATAPVSVIESWEVRIGAADGPVLDMQGADLTFTTGATAAQRRLFLFTNTNAGGTQQYGLYEITSVSGGVAVAVHRPITGFDVTQHRYTGLAVMNQGTGNLAMSAAASSFVTEVQIGATGGTFVRNRGLQANGHLTDHTFGDMSTGQLQGH